MRGRASGRFFFFFDAAHDLAVPSVQPADHETRMYKVNRTKRLLAQALPWPAFSPFIIQGTRAIENPIQSFEGIGKLNRTTLDYITLHKCSAFPIG